jgi:uncharacterized protein (TIGR03435 family)
MKRNVLHVSLLGLLASLAAAQTFDAASVKPSTPQTRSATRGGPGTSDPAQITYTGISLKDLLAKAFGIEKYQLSSPTWSDEARYNIAATMPVGTTRAQFRKMLQNLLIERFHLLEHRESRELPIYALIIAKNGPKLKLSAAPDDNAAADTPVSTVSLAKDGFPEFPAGYKGTVIGMKLNGKWMLRARGETLKDFSKLLSDVLDRPVFDCTGLTEKYDFGVAWSDDLAIQHESSMEPLGSIFGSLAQLGLKLEPRKSPIEMIVVDQVEKTPTAN